MVVPPFGADAGASAVASRCVREILREDARPRVPAGRGIQRHRQRGARAPGHSHATYKLLIGKGIRNLVGQALPPAKRSAETIARCYEAMIADYGEHCLVKTRVYEGVTELVSRLRASGAKLAVFSNKSDELTRQIVASLFAPGDFDVVVGAQPGLPLKPDPAAALLIADRLGVAPSRIVFLGDSGLDMLTATAAGMIAVGAAWGFRTKDELVENGARAVLDQPLELLELLERPR
ncbi:MAG: HAD family hydrolase [Actinobacteria bacterium]|nr:HAD family hydrolase [Actinomycetota bacterium]